MNLISRKYEGLLIVLLITGFVGSGLADRTNNWWTGGASDGLWSSPGNWSESKVPDTNHMVRLGYQGDLNDVADEGQNIDLDEDADIYSLHFDCESNRVVTLDTSGAHTITMRKYGSASAGVIIMPNTADTNAYIDNVTLHYDAGGGRYFLMNSGKVMNFEPNAQLTKAAGTFEGSGAGIWRVRNTINFGWRLRNAGAVYLDGAWMSSLSTDNGHPTTIYVESGGGYLGGLMLGNYLQRYEAGDRVLEIVQFTVPTGSNKALGNYSRQAIEVLETNMTGHLTLKLGGWVLTSGSPDVMAPHVKMDADTTVELVSGGSARLTFGADGSEPVTGLTGPGTVRLKMNAPNNTFTVSRLMDYTGPTILETGILVMASHTIDELSHAYVKGWVELGTYYGSVPTNSPIEIHSNATLRLHADYAQTISELSGDGTVDLSGTTLTVSQGVSPGMSVGTLTVEDAGELAISGGVSAFEMSSDTSVFDRVNLPDGANVTLGGSLEITAPVGFSEYGEGNYIIFDLNGGTIDGSFFPIVAPDRMSAEVDTTGDDVVLVLIADPVGTSIIVH